MDHIIFKSGQVAKHLKGDWLKVMVFKNFVLLLKSFIANLLKCEAQEQNLNAHALLFAPPFSCDFIKTEID